VRGYAAEQGIEPKALIHPIRVAVTGRAVSPPLFDVIAVLGREKVLSRLQHAAGLAAAAA
jgi:glutamyl-tRNA synthetase